MSEILVVTCPSGKQCSRLIPLLYNKGKFKLRLAAHSESSAKKLKELYPDAEVVQAELESLSDCIKLLRGATAINSVLPSLHSREKEIAFNLIDAAVAELQREGNVFKHFVQSSVLCTQHRSLIQHDLKSYVEERLFLSPIDCWTILKPTNFMEFYPVARLASEEEPVLTVRWDPEIPNSVIALKDLAEATAKVLNERESHFFAEYPLCSTLPLSENEVAAIIGKGLGKTVKVHVPSFEGAAERLVKALFGPNGGDLAGLGLASQGDLRGDLVRDAAERLVLYYNHRGLKGSPNVLRWLLGREPTSVAQFVQDILKSR